MSEQQKANNGLMNVANFVKTVAKNAPALALTAAVAPDIMDFMKGLTDPFYQTGEALEELGVTASEGFEEMAQDIADSIYDLQPVAENLGIWIGDTYDKIQEKDWEGLSTNIDTGLTTAWDSVVDFFANDDLMTDIGDGTAAIINGVIDALENVTPDDFIEVGSGIVTALSTALININWGDVFENITNAWENPFNLGIGTAILEWIIRSIIEAMEDTENDPFENLVKTGRF